MNNNAAQHPPQEQQSNYEDMSGVNAPHKPQPGRYENWTMDGSPLRAHSLEQERQLPDRTRANSLGAHSLALPPGKYPPIANSAFSPAHGGAFQERMGSPSLSVSDHSVYMNQEAIDAQEQ
jgi:hypothetical protein